MISEKTIVISKIIVYSYNYSFGRLGDLTVNLVTVVIEIRNSPIINSTNFLIAVHSVALIYTHNYLAVYTIRQLLLFFFVNDK